MNITFLGGPFNGEQHDVPTPLPAEVHADDPQASRPANFLDPAAELAPAPEVVTYRLRTQREAAGTVRHVYVSDDYGSSPALPIIGEPLASTYERHGLREGVHFLAHREAPMTSDRIVTRVKRGYLIAEGAPGATVTEGGLRDALREFARQFPADRQIAGRLEAGALVLRHLANVATSATPRPTWMPQPAALGLPIVQNDTLLPDEWRLLDTDGGVMGEGRLEWKPL